MTNPLPTKSCLNCVHHTYEETEEETETLVCHFHRQLIRCEKQAAGCPDYYTANMDAD